MYKGSVFRTQAKRRRVKMRKRVLVVMFMLLFGTACKQEEQTERGYIVETREETDTIEQIEDIQETREFDFYNSMIFQNGDTKEVYLSTVINTKDYELESMFERVREEYIKLNGEAESLILKLYGSKEAIKTSTSLH
jgi:PBP1b-binding outer membrane lipoprotein LpoB